MQVPNPSVAIRPGGDTTVMLTAAPTRSFTGTLDLRLVDAQGTSANGFTLTPSTVAFHGTQPTVTGVTLHADSAVGTGRHALALEVDGYGIRASLPVSVTVASFTLSLAPQTLSAGLAGSASASLVLTSQDGFAGEVRLSVLDDSGHPARGVSVSPASVTLTAGQSATVPVTLTASARLPAGTFGFTLSASGGGVTRTSPVTLALSSSATGSFAPASAVPVGVGPFSLAVGDFNGDGDPDLATANAGDGTASVMLGSGDGRFANAAGSPFSAGANPYAVAVGDVDANGALDLAVTHHSNSNNGTVSVLLNDGSGALTAAPGSPFAVGAESTGLAVADVNGDGRPDLVIANGGANTVSEWLGDGSGGFAPATSQGSPFAVGNTPIPVALGDFNGDGNLDVAVGNYYSGSVSVLLGDGSGGFAPSARSPFAVGTYPNVVAVGDFNGDGNLDLAAANYNAGTVSVLLGDGSGGFAPAAQSPFAVGAEPNSVVVADFNGDGRLDVATADSGSKTISVLLGQ